jgi:hypothetical protein
LIDDEQLRKMRGVSILQWEGAVSEMVVLPNRRNDQLVEPGQVRNICAIEFFKYEELDASEPPLKIPVSVGEPLDAIPNARTWRLIGAVDRA